MKKHYVLFDEGTATHVTFPEDRKVITPLLKQGQMLLVGVYFFPSEEQQSEIKASVARTYGISPDQVIIGTPIGVSIIDV